MTRVSLCLPLIVVGVHCRVPRVCRIDARRNWPAKQSFDARSGEHLAIPAAAQAFMAYRSRTRSKDMLLLLGSVAKGAARARR